MKVTAEDLDRRLRAAEDVEARIAGDRPNPWPDS
jgi:hypothetical protein